MHWGCVLTLSMEPNLGARGGTEIDIMGSGSTHVTIKNMDLSRGKLFPFSIFSQFSSLDQGKGFCEALTWLSPFLATANPPVNRRLANDSMKPAFHNNFVF